MNTIYSNKYDIQRSYIKNILLLSKLTALLTTVSVLQVNTSFADFRKEPQKKIGVNDEKFLISNGWIGFLDAIDVMGRVVGENNQPLVGATIKIKQKRVSTSTDADGKFWIQDVSESAILIISFIGYETREIKASRNLGVLKLTLSSDRLEEVSINAGYYKVSEKLNTGSISSVSSTTIGKQPISNPLQAIQGRMTGVQIQQTTGNAGGSFKISIRGQNSLRENGNAPLYIIDGVPFPSNSLGLSLSSGLGEGDPLSSLNPNDIESIDVLKDADATAIYGSRGANGVVLINTKKGKSGDMVFDFNVYQGISKVPNFVDLLNTQQYLEMRHEAFGNDNMEPGISDYDLNGAWEQNRYTDWQKELIGGTAINTDIQLSLSGGDSRNTYLFKLGKHRETTVLPSNLADHKYSALLNLGLASLNKRFKANISATYLKDDNNQSQIDPTESSLTLPPNAPAAFAANGHLDWHNGTFSRNPYALLRTKYIGNTTTIVANTVVSYQVLPALNIKSSFGYTQLNMEQMNSLPISAFDPDIGFRQGLSSFATNQINTWIIEPQLEFENKLGKGNLTILLGSTIQGNKADSESMMATFATEFMQGVKNAASSLTSTNSAQSVYKYAAIFSRVNYNYKNKYIFNLTGRRDGSSRFGPNRQFATFGAIGGAWNFINEGFIKDKLTVLSSGKLRSSYGISGSDQIGDYGFYDLWTTTRYAYGSSKGLYPTRLYNPDFAWEKNIKFEVALTFGLLNERVTSSFSYYRNRSGNQLVEIPMPYTTGFGSQEANLAAVVQNTGIEFELNSNVVDSKAFKWSASFNISIPNNKLISFPNIENTAYATTKQVGQSMYIQRSYRYTGLDVLRGVYTFDDLNKDGVLNSKFDYQSLVSNAQKYYGGFQNTFKLRNFDLTIFFHFANQMGVKFLTFFESPGYMFNQPVDVLNRWQKSGDEKPIQRYTQTSTEANTAFQDYRSSNMQLTNASYVRLKNIALSYSLPEDLSRKIKTKNARIYFQAQNVYTFTKYSGLDPETQSASRLPTLRTLTVGIQLIF